MLIGAELVESVKIDGIGIQKKYFPLFKAVFYCRYMVMLCYQLIVRVADLLGDSIRTAQKHYIGEDSKRKHDAALTVNELFKVKR